MHRNIDPASGRISTRLEAFKIRTSIHTAALAVARIALEPFEDSTKLGKTGSRQGTEKTNIATTNQHAVAHPHRHLEAGGRSGNCRGPATGIARRGCGLLQCFRQLGVISDLGVDRLIGILISSSLPERIKGF